MKFLQIKFGLFPNLLDQVLLFLFDEFWYVFGIVIFDSEVSQLVVFLNSFDPVLSQIVKPRIQPVHFHLFQIHIGQVNHELIVCQRRTRRLTNQFQHVIQFLNFLVLDNDLLYNRNFGQDLVGS